MSKRISIGIIVACILLSGAGIFFYHKQVSKSKADVVPAFTGIIDKISLPEDRTSTPVVLEPPATASTSFSLLAFGDIMLDRSVMLKTQAAGDWNHPFLLIDPLLKEYDVRVANLEGPITNFKSIANGTGGARFTFTFSPNFVDPLKNRFEILSLANNHSHNFGQAGLDQTRKFLSGAGVIYFGGPENTAENISVTTSYNGITVGFIGHHQLVEKGFENIIAEAKRLDPEVDLLIAMPHWGIEYEQKDPSSLQKKEAHEMIDAGVDLILGAHPHVVQPIEIYKDKVIFYSQGNFIFDQYFSEETMTGLAVGIDVEKINGVIDLKYKLIPLDINKQSQPSVAVDPKKQKVLDHLYTYSSLEQIIKDQMKIGVFQNQYTAP